MNHNTISNQGKEPLYTYSQIHAQILEQLVQLPGHTTYKVTFFIYSVFVGLLLSMRIYSPNFYFMNPVFSCQGTDGSISEEEACLIIDFCHLENVETLTNQLNLYCGVSTPDRILIQTAPSFGQFIGAIFGGVLSDTKGRKVCFIFGLFLLNISCILQFVGAQANSVGIMTVAELITGLSSQLITTNCLILMTRFLSKQEYEFATILWFVAANGISQIIIVGILQFLPGWKHLSWACIIPTLVLTVLSFKYILEDPILLFDYGKIFECKAIIKSIVNSKTITSKEEEQQVLALFAKIDRLFENKMRSLERNRQFTHNSSHQLKLDFSNLWRRDIIFRVLVMGCLGFFKHLTNDCLQSDYYTRNFDLFLVGVSNTMGLFVMFYLIQIEEKRRRGFIYSSLLEGGIIMLLLAKYTNFQQYLIVFFMRFFICWNNGFWIRLKIDMFPERYQQTLITSIQLVSNLGHFVSPTFITGIANLDYDPIIVSNLFRLILGTIPAFFLIESKIQVEETQENDKENITPP